MRHAVALVDVLELHAVPSVNRRRVGCGLSAPRGALVAAVLALAFLAAGCGSGDDESPTAAWVDGFCGVMATWKGEVQEAGSSLKDADQLSRATLEGAADDVSRANDAMVDDLETLGSPPREATAEAEDAVDVLRSRLRASVAELEAATADVSGPTEILEAVSTASAVLLTMASDVKAAAASLQELDAADEWRQAFSDSDACGSLRQS